MANAFETMNNTCFGMITPRRGRFSLVRPASVWLVSWLREPACVFVCPALLAPGRCAVAYTVQLDRMFQEVKFFKPGSEIAEKARAKVAVIAAKITKREKRMAEVCAEHSLSPADLFALAQSGAEHAGTGSYLGGYGGGGTYKAPVRDLPAGVVSSLVTESEQIESERRQVRTLELLARNIDPSKNHEISFAELEYLAF